MSGPERQQQPAQCAGRRGASPPPDSVATFASQGGKSRSASPATSHLHVLSEHREAAMTASYFAWSAASWSKSQRRVPRTRP